MNRTTHITILPLKLETETQKKSFQLIFTKINKFVSVTKQTPKVYNLTPNITIFYILIVI